MVRCRVVCIGVCARPHVFCFLAGGSAAVAAFASHEEGPEPEAASTLAAAAAISSGVGSGFCGSGVVDAGLSVRGAEASRASCPRAASAKTSAAMASTMGMARLTTHGSWRLQRETQNTKHKTQNTRRGRQPRQLSWYACALISAWVCARVVLCGLSASAFVRLSAFVRFLCSFAYPLDASVPSSPVYLHKHEGRNTKHETWWPRAPWCVRDWVSTHAVHT